MKPSVLYIGIHTQERADGNNPRLKAEVIIPVPDYGKASKLLRILKINAEKLLKFPEKETESYLGELMKDRIFGGDSHVETA